MAKILIAVAGLLTSWAAISACYFLALVIHLPFWGFCILALLLLAGIIYILRRPYTAAVNDKSVSLLFAAVVIAACSRILWVTFNQYYQPYGDWDGLAIWNYHARFLFNSDSWQQLYQTTTYEHPDYPHALPALIAIFWRLQGMVSPIVPMVVAQAAIVAVVLINAAFFWPRNKMVAILILLFYCSNEVFLKQSISEFADLPLGLFFLFAHMSLFQYRQTKSPEWLLLSGAATGGMIWMKNEGLMLAVILAVFYFRLLFRKDTVLWLLAGLALPLAALTVHKGIFAPDNDLFREKQEPFTFSMLIECAGRIWAFFRNMIWDQFRAVFYVTVIYAAGCLLLRTWPSRAVWCSLCALMGYFIIYMLNADHVEWLLRTSMDRLLVQLMPSFLFALGLQVTGGERQNDQLTVPVYRQL